MILYCDPSARAFGWILIQEGTPISAGCWDLLEYTTKKASFAVKSRDITWSLVDNLDRLYDQIPFDEIHAEVPTGSQSTNVAWYLSAVQSTIIAWCNGKEVYYDPYRESDIKKKMHGRTKKVDKKETVKFVLDNYPQFSYLIESLTEAKRQAISDAIAVYHAHQNG